MRRTEVLYRPEAIADLELIYDHVATSSGSHITARRIVDRILTRCEKIGDVPEGGRPRNDLMEGLRTVPFERRAVIAYVVTRAVEITNIFYGGRDFEALYRTASSYRTDGEEEA